jgi:hypothetical protein
MPWRKARAETGSLTGKPLGSVLGSLPFLANSGDHPTVSTTGFDAARPIVDFVRTTWALCAPDQIGVARDLLAYRDLRTSGALAARGRTSKPVTPRGAIFKNSEAPKPERGRYFAREAASFGGAVAGAMGLA